MLEFVQLRGMLRRDAKPEFDLLRELLFTLLGEIPCAECGGLGASMHDDWDDEWSIHIYCEGCKAVIAAERLEVFPYTKLCPQCQSDLEAGGAPGAATEYCSHCGGILKLRKRSGKGLAGYQMVCTDCGKKE